MKNIAVVFTKTNARILVNPKNISEITHENYILNPDLSKVSRIPPHFWKLECGEVTPMSEAERKVRLRQIELFGVDNSVKPLSKRQFKARSFDYYMLKTAALWLFLLYGSMFFVVHFDRVENAIKSSGLVAFLQNLYP